ncbi:hypothetical protein ACSC1U_01495 [Mammaliicoccus lentus]
MEILNLSEEIKFEEQERIYINTGSDKNLLELARKNMELKKI